MESSSSTSPPSDAAAVKANTRFNFQHFDQESDFGVEDENGERVRKRKRPGRKPNPPTIQERREQNRAAQRAFREREQHRKQQKDRENQLHLEELIRTRKRLAEVQYEANYLRGCVLLLCMTNLVERGSVPHIWTDTRVFPISWNGIPPSLPNDNVNNVPAILKTVLDENNQILDFQSSLTTARCTGWSLPNQIEQLLNGVDSFIPPRASTDTNTDLKDAKSPSLLSTSQKNRDQKRKEQIRRMRDEDSDDEDTLSASARSESIVSNFTATKNVCDTVTDTPTLKTSDDLAHMPPLQALHILRLQLKISSVLGDLTRTSLIPTALQRLIPHDIRIDYTPGASLRDRMILFQGFYDSDECFELLSKKTMFIGGDPRDTRNWVPHPTFSEKYWFLSHQLVDHDSGECALIPEIINAILTSQREKEDEMKKPQKEKEEQEQEEETSSSAQSTSTQSSTTRRAPLSSVRNERSSNIRSLPLDL